ncbi:hypothetical protein EDB84DRAFT_337845 [Lactarius hengduanensis]|nr:hypothetical protein EDB84DRAFT_337845 [Lactarius hengduanensis]
MPCMTFAKIRTPIYELGYKAIVRMSEERPRWLERDVDVLVQLLQSALQTNRRRSRWSRWRSQHLELDSKVTLGILCDQIVPPDDPMDNEDKTIRERLRALVVAFLAQDARKPLLAQLQGQGRGAAEQGDALIDNLIKAISKTSAADVATISSSFCPRSTTDGRRGAGTSLCTYCSRAPPRRSGRTLRPGGTRRAWSSTRPSPVKSGSSESGAPYHPACCATFSTAPVRAGNKAVDWFRP